MSMSSLGTALFASGATVALAACAGASPSPGAAATTAAAAAPPTAVAASPAAGAPVKATAGDRATSLSARRLAAGVVFGCADSRDTRGQRQMSRLGIGGIVLLGANPPYDLARRLKSVQRAAPAGHSPVIASDEEGGAVQRLAALIRPLPSAKTMGSWPDRRIQRTAASYAADMKALGVGLGLAPVADLGVPGSYIDRLGRAFSSDPGRVGRAVNAWSDGLRSAGVIPVAKHWPGHGHAADTHQQAARVPAYSTLRGADLLPFGDYLDHGRSAGPTAVMVAHVQSAGLTRRGEPATQSARALRVLRDQAGPDAVIITDSLSMAAASTARGLSEPAAVVAALRAGADWAMVCTSRTGAAVAAVARALRSGELSRPALEASYRRIAGLTRR